MFKLWTIINRVVIIKKIKFRFCIKICDRLDHGKHMHQIKKTSRKQVKETAGKGPASKSVSRHKTPWEIASKLMAGIPAEAWDTVSSDLSINVDHYLYEAPKQNKS